MNTTTPSEIVFIDSSIPDYQLILGAIPAAWSVVVLNDQEDGLVQITHALSQYTQLTAVHIVSHAETARLNLGSARIDSHNLNQYSDSLQSWKQSLAVNADILLYGCDLAQGDLGQNFINQFSRLTGFDVAASSNPTSAASDFVLEKNAGAIETPTLNLSLGGWQGELGTVLNANNTVFSFDKKTNIVGTGVNNNDVVRFNSVATIDGQSLDAVVKTTLNKATISSYDSTSSPTSVARYFQPTIVSTSANGYAQFDVSFYLAGTYNGAGTGTQLTLQNLTVNSYDIDTVTGVHQYQVFGGFSTYTLASAANSTPSALQTSVLADGSVKFLATGSGNGAINSTTADDTYRVSVKYDSVQTLSLRGGSDANNASSGFALDFGPGVNWAGATTARDTPAKNLVYSQSVLNETARNDGSILGSVVINLVNDTFTGTNGDDLVSSGKAVVTGLPAGISASVSRNSATSVLINFTGQALSHQAIDSSTVFIRFADSALTSGQAATVTGNGDHATALNFQNQPVLLYSNDTFYEAAANNGAIANSLVISLSGDTFSSSVVSANKIITSPLPAGLSANFVRIDDTHLLATLSGTASNHGVSNDQNALTFSFLDGAFANTASAAQVSNAVNNQLKIDFANPGAVIAFSDTSFTEAANNNGSITQTLTLNLSGDSFTGNTGDNLLAGKAVVNNLPSGLTASLQRTSASTAVLSLTGNAVAHAAVNSVGNLGISFSDTAFSGGNAANIARATNANMLAIQFTDPPALSYSSSTFLESADNDGTIANTLTVTLQNDTFSSNVLSKITPVNVPAGLTASFTRVDDTHLTISLAGTASAHTNLSDISNLGFTFQNGAFTNTALASGVKNYAKNDLGVDFTNYVLITAPVLSYSAGGFVESVANDGSIANHLIITLTKDTFASDVISAGKVLLSNLPAGLQANFVRLDDNHLDLSLSGSATQHANANDRGDLSLTFLDGAFTSTARAANVTNYIKNDLSLDFNDPPSLAYSANSFTESPLNNGSLANTLTITLSNDQFAADIVSGNKILVSNLPAGLTPVFTLVDSTHLTVSLGGTVSAHANLNDVTTLSFNFLSGAFVNTASAANVANAIKNDLRIDFNDNPVLTYSGDTFSEAAANTGAIGNSLRITLANDTFVTDVANKIEITQLPSGLTAQYTRVNDTTVDVALIGSAIHHSNRYDVNNLGIRFLDGAFVSNAYASSAQNYNQSNLKIDFNDAPPNLVLSRSSVTTSESQGSAMFSVALASEPSSAVSIAVTGIDLTEGHFDGDPNATSSTLSFDASDWDQPKYVRLNGIDDTEIDGDIAYTLTLSSASADSHYSSKTAQVTVTNTDNDSGSLIVSSYTVATNEIGDQASVNLTLGSKPSANVTVAVTGLHSTEGRLNTSSLVFTPENWNTDQILQITGVDDTDLDGTVGYTLTLTATSTDTHFSNKTAAITVNNADNEGGGLTVSSTSLSTNELGTTSANFTVQLISLPTSPVSVTISGLDSTEGTLPGGTSLTFGPSDWNQAKTVTVTAVDDSDLDGNILYTLSLTSSSDDIRYINKTASVTVTNIDNESGAIRLSDATVITSESAGSANVNLTLNGQPDSDVIVDFTGLVATEGTMSSARMTFTRTNWNTPQTLTITGVDDSVLDGNQIYTLTATSTSNDSRFSNKTAALTVTNTDNEGGSLSLSSSALTTSEAGASASFSVRLSSQPSNDVTVSLAGLDETEGLLMSANQLTFTSTNWNTGQLVQLAGLDDAEFDGDIRYTLTATSASVDSHYQNKSATVVITNIDNETAGLQWNRSTVSTTESGGSSALTLVLNAQPSDDVSIAFSGLDTTEGSLSTSVLTFTTANWNTPQPLIISGVDDSLVDGNIIYTLTATATSNDSRFNSKSAAVTVTNTDNDGPAFVLSKSSLITRETGSSSSFNVQLGSQPSADVTVSLSGIDSTEGQLYTGSQLVFNHDNWNTPQMVLLAGVDDTLVDGDITYSLTLTSSSSDSSFQNKTASVAVTNIDNESAGLLFSETHLDTSESGGSSLLTVVLNSQPTQDVTIGFSGVDISEGKISTNSIKFTRQNWDTPQPVTISGVDDDIADGNIIYTLMATSQSDDSRYRDKTAQLTVTNYDNEGGLILSSTTLKTSEAGSSAILNVLLNSQPSQDVTVNISGLDQSEGQILTGNQLTFTPTDWNLPHMVLVNGVDDTDFDGDIVYGLTLTAVSADTGFNNKRSEVSVTNLDDDFIGIVLDKPSITTSETGTSAEIQLVLNTQPTSEVVIDFSGVDGSEDKISVNSLSFTPDNWNIPQSVIFTGVDDDSVDGNVNFTVKASAQSLDQNYQSKSADLEIINTDNDFDGLVVSALKLSTSESGEKDTFSIALSAKPVKNVSIKLSGLDSSEGSLSTNTLQFTASNWDQAQPVTVTGVDDNFNDGNIRYTLTASAVSNDTYFSNKKAFVTVENLDNEGPGLKFSSDTAQTSESGTSALLSLVLSSQPAGEVTVTLSGVDDTEGQLLTGTQLTFNANDWDHPHSIIVQGVDDPDPDGDIRYTLLASATSSDQQYQNKTATLIITNLDDEASHLLVDHGDITTSENGTKADFSLALSSQPTSNVTVTLEGLDSTEGRLSATRLTFSPTNWKTPQTVTVTGVEDNQADGDILYTLTARSNSADSAFNAKTATINVTNTDNEAAGVSFSKASVTTSESGLSAAFSVALNSQPASEVSVNLVGIDATEGQLLTGTTLTFDKNNWNRGQTVILGGVDDTEVDGDINYTLTAISQSSDSEYNQKSATLSVTNLDDDGESLNVSRSSLKTSETGTADSFVVSLSSKPTANVTLTVGGLNSTEGRLNTSKLTFTPANWLDPQTVTVTGVDDVLVDGDVVYSLNLTSSSTDSRFNAKTTAVKVTNLDDEGGGLSFSTSAVVSSEAGTSASFTLMLNSQPNADVTVNLSGVDDTEGEILTGNSLTFSPDNWNQPKLLILQGLDDPIVDGDIRYTLTASAQSNDIHFNNKQARLSVVNTDNDAGGITLSASSLVSSENGDSASFSAVLGSRPLSPVNIVVTGLDETEGALSQTSLSFDATNWNQAQTITVKGLDDTLADGDIPYELAVTSLSSDPNYNAKAFKVKVTNLDNEVGGIVVDKSQITTSEYLTSDNFSVALKSQPLSDVTVNISGLDTTEGRLSTNSLSFSNTNWNIPQPVTVTGVEDNLYDGKIRYTLTLTSAGDPAYDGKNAKTATVDVSNLDNFLKVEDITVNEGSPYSVFRVYGSEGQQLQLALQASGTNYAPMAGNAQIGVDIENKIQYFDGDQWQTYTPGQSITYPDGSTTLLARVPIINDSVFEKQESFKLAVTTNQTTKYGIGIISDDGQGPVFNESGAEVLLQAKRDDDRALQVNSFEVNEGSQYAVFTILSNSQASVKLDLLQMAINNGAVATIGVDTGNQLQYFDGKSWLNYQADSKVAITNGSLSVRFTIRNDATKEGPESLRLIATDDVLGSVFGSCVIRDDGSGSVWLGDGVTPKSDSELSAAGIKRDDDFDQDGIEPNVEEILATMSASTGKGGKDGDLNADGVQDADQNSVSTFAWIKSSYFDDAASGNLTQTKPIVYLAAEASSATTKADQEYQLSNIDVKPITDSEFGGTSSLKIANNPADKVVNAWDPLVFNLSARSDAGTTKLNDIDPGRSGTQVQLMVDISRSNVKLTDLNAYLKFVSKDTISAAKAANINLVDLDGKAITTEGWYDFTRKQNSSGQYVGDGARFIVDGLLIKAIELTLTDNAFGDNDMRVDQIYDPGTPVLKSTTITASDTPGLLVNVNSLTTTELGKSDTYTVALMTKPTSNVTVKMTGLDTTEGSLSSTSLSFTPSNWNTPQTVVVTGVDDNSLDGDISYTLTASSSSSDSKYSNKSALVTVTNLDNEGGDLHFSTDSVTTSETGTEASFTLVLTRQPTQDVQVSLTGIDDTEGALQTAQKLSFTAANWNVPQTVRIKGVDDTLVDGNIRYTLTASSSSNDIHYSNKSAAVTVTNTDNDAGGLLVTPDSITTQESGQSGSFTVSLKNQPVSPVTVYFSGLDTTEGELSSKQLTFSSANWNTPQTVSVKGVDDPWADGDIQYNLSLTSASSDPNFNNKTATVSVKNLDNEVVGLIVDKSTLITSEPDVADQFNVVLKTQPLTNVTVTLSGLDETEGRLSADKLVFTPDNWNKPQTIVVTGVDDNLYDRKIVYTLDLKTSGDQAYDGANVQHAQVKVTNLDNYLKVENVTVNEGSPYAVMRIYGSEGQQLTLALQETGTNFAALAGNAQIGVDIGNNLQYFDGDAWQNYSPGQKVTYPEGSTTLLARIAVKNDPIYEKQESFKLNVTSRGVTQSGVGIITDDGQGPIFNESGAEVLNPDLDDDRLIKVKTFSVNEGSDYAVFTISSASQASVRLDLLEMAVNNGAVAKLGVDSGNVLQYFDGSTWQNYQTDSKLAISNGNLYVRLAIHNDPIKEGPESLRLIATDDALGSSFGTCLIRDDGSGSVWLGNAVTPSTPEQLAAINFDLDDDFDRDGIAPNVEEILATMSASTGRGGYDGDLNEDGVQDADQNSVSTFAWIKSSYFDDALAGNLTQVKPIVYLAAEASSSSAKADLEYQLSGIKVKTLTAPEFGGTSAIKITNSLTDTVVNAWDPLLFHISAISGSGSSGLHDCDALRAGTQVTAYIDVSRANVSVTDLNAYLKFVSKDTISAAKAANINLVDLDGKAITTEGWYDFTRKQNSSGQYVGDGARFIVDGLLIKAIELTLTDNAFGDNDMRVDQIYDPGTPVLKSTTITASDTPGLLVNVNSLTTTELGKSDTYTVALMTKPSNNVTVKMSGLDTTEGSLSSSSLSFTTSNWNTPQTVVVTGVDDNSLDGDISYTLTASSSSSDSKYSNKSALVTVTNLDNEGGDLHFSTDSVTTSETGTEASFTLVLTRQPTQDVQVSLTGIDDTEGALQTVQKLSFSAANWNVPQTVRIKGVDDTLVDGNIRYTLTASSSSNDIHYSNKSAAVTLTNNDNDGGGLQVTPDSIVTRETGESGSFSVALKTQPVSPVTVFIAGLDSTEGVLSNNQLVWDTNNWNIPQTVTVKGLDDSLADGDIHYDLKLTSVSMDQNYNGNVAVVNVTNQDNEAGILVVDKSTLTTSEPDVADQFNVVLKTQPQTNVTVSLSGLDVTEGRLSADELVFTPDSWNKPQTVVVTGVDDNLYDRNVKYTLELRTSGDKAYDGVNSQIAQVEVTNLDDYLQVENITVNEGSPYAVFRIYGSEGQRLSLGLEETGTNFAALAGNAQIGVDIGNNLQYFDGDAWQNYSPSQTVTYPRGSTTLLVRVAVKNDTVFEKQETFKLKVATNHQIKYGTGIISDDGQGPIYNDSGAEVLNPDLDDDRVFRIKTIAVNEGSDYAVFTIENPSPASVRLDLLAMAINNGPVATLGVDCGNSLQYFDGSTWQNYQAESKVAINNGKLFVRVAIHNDPLKEGPESLRLIATDDVQGSTSGSCLIRDDGSGSVWLGDSVKALTKAEINARQFVLDDDFDRDGVLPNVEEILATMSASTGHGGNDGDLNADGLIDSDQSAVATMAWIKADYFQAAVDGTLTKVTPIVYIAAEPSSSHVQADYEYQLSNIDVKPLIDPAFGGTSAIKLQNAAGEEILSAWDPLQFVLKPNINTNTQHLNDIDPVRSGTQVKVLIDISRANATLTSLNAYLKFVPQTTIDAAHSANINLLDLDGKPITTEGWYDFTQHRDAKGQWTGDGAHFITDGIDIKAIELTLTDNAFGDDDMSVDRILDPGTPVLKSSRQPVSIISKNTVIADPEVDNITLANVTSSGVDCVPSVLLGSVKNNGKPVNSNATGNALNNSLSGNDGNNILDGGLGNDVLKGESGNDTLVGGAGSRYFDRW